MSHPPTYKPSPLSYGSPRTSPFKRPDSPASPSPANHPTTPTPSPTKNPPSKLQQHPSTPPSTSSSDWTPRALLTAREPPTSPTRTTTATKPHNPTRPTPNANNDALSTLPATQVRSLREGFQILDRDNDGFVTRDDVQDMLTNLGLDATPTATAPFFPPATPSTLPLATYLSTLSTLLAPLSSRTELMNAFAAFDERDGGEVDVGELRDALLHTAPTMGEREVEEALGGFVGRRAFGEEGRGGAGAGSGGGARGEVFRYREWVAGLMGGEERKDGEM